MGPAKDRPLKIILFLLSISIALSACRKDRVWQHPMNPALKAAFGFNVGSYWVYRDSVSGETDSFYVYYSSFYTTHYPDNQAYEMMDISLRKYSTSGNDSEKWGFILGGSECSFWYNNSKDPHVALYGIPFFSYPFKIENLFSSNGDTGYTANIYADYMVAGHQYNNVITSYHKNRPAPISNLVYNDVYYISDSIGLIKVIFDHPEDSVYRVLELTKYKIVK